MLYPVYSYLLNIFAKFHDFYIYLEHTLQNLKDEAFQFNFIKSLSLINQFNLCTADTRYRLIVLVDRAQNFG